MTMVPQSPVTKKLTISKHVPDPGTQESHCENRACAPIPVKLSVLLVPNNRFRNRPQRNLLREPTTRARKSTMNTVCLAYRKHHMMKDKQVGKQADRQTAGKNTNLLSCDTFFVVSCVYRASGLNSRVAMVGEKIQV